MDFFSRKRPCLLIEEQHTLENTKKLFLNKINFLQKQYKFCFESLRKNSNIAPEFIRGALFSFDFGSKVLDSLSHLTGSTEVEWKFLKSFVSDSDFGYILGNFKKNYSILCIEKIFNNSDSFFFDLFRLRAIDLGTWKNLCLLKSLSDSFGLACPNDFPYYCCKDTDVVDPIPALKNSADELRRAEEEFYKFLGRPINFRHFSPIIWRFFRIVEENKSEDDVIFFLKKNKYNYDQIRQNKENFGDSSLCFPAMAECLSNLKSFSDLYFASFEFDLFGNPSMGDLFKHILLFFFSQGEKLMDSLAAEFRSMGEEERVVNAICLLYFISSLSRHEISLPREFGKAMDKNFRSLCELCLSTLKGEGAMKRFCLLNFFGFSLLLDQVKSLRANRFYEKNYSKYIDDLLPTFPEVN